MMLSNKLEVYFNSWFSSLIWTVSSRSRNRKSKTLSQGNERWADVVHELERELRQVAFWVARDLAMWPNLFIFKLGKPHRNKNLAFSWVASFILMMCVSLVVHICDDYILLYTLVTSPPFSVYIYYYIFHWPFWLFRPPSGCYIQPFVYCLHIN